MAAEIEIVFKAVDTTAGAFGGILGNLGNMGNIVTGVKAAFDLAGDAIRLFTGYAEEGLNAISTYERLSLSLETLSASQAIISGEANNMAEALKMTAGEAQDLLNWMQELAIKSPFTLEGVANAFRLAEAYGFSADEAKRMTQALIDFAAGTGASEEAMSRIALALGQIEAKGKLSGQEVLQLVNAGLPVTQILANAFDVTTAEIEKMRSDGLIPAQAAIEAITTYLETNFAGAAERQATSWAGLKGTFADIKQMGLREFFGGMFDVLQPLAVELSNFLQTEGLQNLKDIGQTIGDITQKVVDLFVTTGSKTVFSSLFDEKTGENGIEVATYTLKTLDEILTGIKNKLILFFDGLDINIDFSAWAESIDWQALSDVIVEKVDSINWQAVGNVIGEHFADIFSALGTFIGEVDWGALVTSIGNGLIGLFEGVIDKGADGLIQGLANAFNEGDVSALQDAFKNVWSKLSIGWDDIFDLIVSGGLSDITKFGFDDIGRAIGDGIKSGIVWAWGNLMSILDFLFSDLIKFVKAKLGIASASTVFKEISTNIVQGLIDGWNALFNTFKSLINSGIDAILQLFAPFLALFGVSVPAGGTTTGGATGTFGGFGTGSTTGGTTPASGYTIIHNNYGTVYYGYTNAAGDYDCPSPHPLVASSGNQLVTTGF